MDSGRRIGRQLRYANGFLQGDVNGDAVADFRIAVTGLNLGDVIL